MSELATGSMLCREGGREGRAYLGESIKGMPVLAVKRPADLLIQILQPQTMLVCHMPKDGMDGLGFVVSLFALDHVVGGDATLGKINIT